MLNHEEILEIGKILSDFLKQMITLNTGMIVLIITIVEKVFTTEVFFRKRFNIALLSASITCFIASLWLSLVALAGIPVNLTDMLQGGASNLWVDNFSFYSSLYSFLGGMIIFFLLAIINFSSKSHIKTDNVQKLIKSRNHIISTNKKEGATRVQKKRKNFEKTNVKES